MSKEDEIIDAKKELATLNGYLYGANAIGHVGGLLFAHHRKSSFWGYVGWFIVGGFATGIPTRLVMNKRFVEAQANIEKLAND